MIGGADKITSLFGHVYPGGYDLLIPTIARAVKAGFHVHLLQPDSSTRACTLPDRQAAKPHDCWHPIAPMENLARVKPFVRTAVERAEARYLDGDKSRQSLNIAIDLHPSGYSQVSSNGGPPTIGGPVEAWLVTGTDGEGGLVLVPPSVLGGQPLWCWSVSG